MQPRGIFGRGYESHGTMGNFLSFASSNKLRFHLFRFFYRQEAIFSSLSEFRILFLATQHHLWTKLRVVSVSERSGYVTPPGYPFTPVPANMRASLTLHVPQHQSIMLSFLPQLNLHLQRKPYPLASVTVSNIHLSKTVSSTEGYGRDIPAELYDGCVNIKLTTLQVQESFKIYYSFHAGHARPYKSNRGMFNCSVPYYASFKDHLHCNLKQECEGREDEGGHCPFSSPACDGDMAVAGTKCFSLHVTQKKISWLEAKGLCEDRSGQLAILRSQEEVYVLLNMLRIANRVRHTYVGLFMDTEVPRLYRKTWRWVDNTVAYSAPKMKMSSERQMGCHSLFADGFVLRAKFIHEALTYSYTCEHKLANHSFVHTNPQEAIPNAIKADYIYLTQEKLQPKLHRPLTICPGGYVTHDFLKCDLQAACLVKQYELHCPLDSTATGGPDLRTEQVRMFVCDNLIHTLPYTLVCNFSPDCLDGSDETFCQHGHTTCDHSQHQCASGQCVALGKSRVTSICDKVSDCYDGSDEAACSFYRSKYKPLAVKPVARIDFDQKYSVTSTELDKPYICPDTHFNCIVQMTYCLPIYVLCNGYYDCPQKEDELGCENYTCPGFYRCRGTSVCVHVTQLCDGVAQCEGRDDEMLCEFLCPHHCQCQGWAFVCRQSFPAHSFPQLRYLDAGHSLMTLGDLVNNSYLVWLSLHSCQLQELSNSSLGNLQTLDVSNNLIESVDVDSFHFFPNLKEIRLSNNPLVTVIPKYFTEKQTFLYKIDLSQTRLAEFDCGIFSGFSTITDFNFSHCGIVRVSRKMFTCFTYLNQLDVRGTKLVQESFSLVQQQDYIEAVFSDDYRHCCPTALPTVQHKVFCLAPFSGLSSCSHLVRLQLHRTCLWVMTIFSFIGNACCIVVRYLHGHDLKGASVEIFMFNLGLANLMMATYLSIILAADLHFHGNFLAHERDWVASLSCRTAAFLALVSSDVSRFTVFLLSVDRLVAVAFSSGRFQVKSISLTCLVSVLIAVLLNLPFLVSVEDRSCMTNLCLPVPTLESDPHSRAYFWGVVVTLNTVLTLVTCISQSLVYHQVRSKYVIATSSQISRDMALAQRVMTLVVTDVIWRMGITTIGLLAYVISDDVLEATLVLGVPLKPVLNPLLYTSGLLAEKRKRKAECRLLKLVQRTVRSQAVKSPQAKSDPSKLLSLASQEDVFRHVRRCLQTRILHIADVQAVLAQYD